MKTYKNLGGDSPIVGYEIGPESITVEFDDGSIYVYDYESSGRQSVEQMKDLASAGQYLNSFINRFVRKKYAAKLR